MCIRDRYNATPHRGLPRFVDGTGKRRNYSPDEYWGAFTAQNWEPVTVPEDLREELFMPAEQRQVRNGWITFYNAKYFSFELADFHGERVQVRYDIWDPSKAVSYTHLDVYKRQVPLCAASGIGHLRYPP